MTTKKTATKNVLFPAVKSQAHGLELTAVREIAKDGKVSYVLCFGNEAEVIMPGNWRVRETDFPNGLYEGIRLNAFWEKDAEGNDRFHLEEVK